MRAQSLLVVDDMRWDYFGNPKSESNFHTLRIIRKSPEFGRTACIVSCDSPRQSGKPSRAEQVSLTTKIMRTSS